MVIAAGFGTTSWHIRGNLPAPHIKRLCIVGSRDNSGYGKDVCEYIIEGLRGYPIAIVSGLAFGIDTIAHRAAIANNLHTIAFPGSSIDDASLYPRAHVPLAQNILNAGGCLLSGFAPGSVPRRHTFVIRNEYMTSWCDAVLIIEGRLKSGSLITAMRGIHMNKEVLAVPGSVFSELAEGTHYLLTKGATPVRSAHDVLSALNLLDQTFDFATDSTKQYCDEALFTDCTSAQKAILRILRIPQSRDQLYAAATLPIIEFNTCIAELELRGYIQEKYSLFRRTR